MTIEIGIQTFSPSAGDVDITTTALNGVTPKVAIFMLSQSLTVGTLSTSKAIALGVADGTNQWCVGQYSAGGQTGGWSNRRFKDTICSGRLSTNNNFSNESTFVKFLSTTDTGDSSTGVRITTASGGSYKGICLLIGGDDFSVAAGIAQLGLSGSTTNVTAPGFRSQLTLIASDNRSVNHGASRWGPLSLGFAHNNGTTITQRCLATLDENGAATTSLNGELFTDRIAAQINAGSIAYEIELKDNANGFDLAVSGGNANEDLGYLAMDFGPRKVWVGTIDTPTTTGDDAQIGLGFKPALVGLLQTMFSAVDTFKTDGEPGAFGFGFMSDSEEASFAGATEDGVTTTNAEAKVSNNVVDFNDHAGVDAYDGTFVSMNGDGFTINYSAVIGTARKWPAFAISAATKGSSPGAVMGL